MSKTTKEITWGTSPYRTQPLYRHIIEYKNNQKGSWYLGLGARWFRTKGLWLTIGKRCNEQSYKTNSNKLQIKLRRW